jgi:hypothetical protein
MIGGKKFSLATLYQPHFLNWDHRMLSIHLVSKGGIYIDSRARKPTTMGTAVF